MVNAGKTCSQGNYLPGRLVFLKPRLSSHIEGCFWLHTGQRWSKEFPAEPGWLLVFAAQQPKGPF
jgi:hypothetical protein